MSPKSAGLAKKMGYADVRVYLEGEPAWKKAGNYTASTIGFVEKENIVLVDLRSAEKVKQGYIPRAVNIPASELAKAENKFPAYMKAPIVLYSDKKGDLQAAAKTIKGWGYKETTVFLGGIDAWKAKGLELKTGAASTVISYVKKLKPFEVSIADFEKALKTGSAVIVDVRTPDEFKKGHFKGAVNIPAEDMSKRFAELPKDKPIYFHCSTGVRAEMAYDTLKEKGYDVKCLLAIAAFEGEKYTISE
ncbi:MAG: rhodanese [Nitrospirae bacterium]|nr:rhodanese [Nitrospirota bacterium]